MSEFTKKHLTLDKWALIAEIVGGLAIVLSLIFVGLEIRENTRVTMLTSDRAVDQQNLALNLSVASSADFADLLVRGEADRSNLTEAERARFDNYCLSRFGAYENVVANFSGGLVPEEEYDIWGEHFRYRFDKPGYRQFWLDYRTRYFPVFRAWADEQFGITAD